MVDRFEERSNAVKTLTTLIVASYLTASGQTLAPSSDHSILRDKIDTIVQQAMERVVIHEVRQKNIFER